MEFLASKIQTYIEAASGIEPPLLRRLRRETHVKVLYPRMLSGPYQGRVLSMLSHLLAPKYILEIGTFTGYGTICLAEGLAAKGKLVTLEKNEELDFMIYPYLKEAGIEEQVEVRFGNALDHIEKLDGPFDLVFIDADKGQYVSYYEAVLSKLSSRGVILADNVLWYGKILDPQIMDKETVAIREFNKRIQEDDRVEQVLLPIRDGLMMIRKKD